MKRPTFFISSTIYDFKDLRSAIKFYLEEQGCKVLASELNDFEKPIDTHSYDACLSAIRDADYFLLLIGTRVGGWFDEPNRISITQREYREAYEQHRRGRLKLLTFVRPEVWQMKEDRRELARFLETLELNESTRKAIANYPSKFATDAEFLINFINEVGRNQETKIAIQNAGVRPTGNWIHVPTSFRDIVDVLQTQFLHSIPIEDMMVRRLLRRELRDFVRKCLCKFKSGHVYSPREWIEKFHTVCPITVQDRFAEHTVVQANEWDPLCLFSAQLLGGELHPIVLPQVLSMPTFLEFDLQTDAYQETVVYEALLLLQDQIRRFTEARTSEVLSVTLEYSPRGRVERGIQGSTFGIETQKLLLFLHLLDRWVNVLELCRSLIRHLEGEPFVWPELRSDSPVQGMQELLDNEMATDEEVTAYVAQEIKHDR